MQPPKKLGLYIHIPFCKSKCGYCDFYSLTNSGCIERYVDALALHMKDYSIGARGYLVDTIFLGGGTPSILPQKLLVDLIGEIHNNFRVDKNVEFTMEANPATIDLKSLKAYRSAGVNRLSIGMQSAHNNELKELSRIHTKEEFEESYRVAREAKFENINLDVMYGIPDQTMESFNETLQYVFNLNPEHISMYGLKIEENTPFAKRMDDLNLPDEDNECDMYFSGGEQLEAHGYHQYEISNFSKDGKRCAHNLKYWNCEEYLGLGPAAHSYFNNTRFSFKADLGMYLDAIEDVNSAIDITDENYVVSPNERVGEYIMLRFRLNEGIHTDAFRELFSMDFDRLYGKKLMPYIENDFMRHENGRYYFTPKGMYVSNYILATIVKFDTESSIVTNIINGTDK